MLRCKSKRVFEVETQKKFECVECGYQFSVLTQTIFHDTHLPLETWFMAVLLLCEARKGMSANQVKRTLGVSYKTAWYLCHRIRAAMKEAELPRCWMALSRWTKPTLASEKKGRAFEGTEPKKRS